jgi:ribosome-associated protein
MTTEAAAKKDIQKLQRAIVDGLEDVKAQDIQVFNTEHLSPLFERVIIASGTSNRQTKALAASVRDAVREAGFSKPRIEGEENGEWIIADCGAAVVHIMQPTIRQYYHLEDLWGEKPVRIKFGADKPTPAAKAAAQAAEKTGKADAKPASLRRSSAAKQGVADAFPSKAALAKAQEAKTGAKPAAKRPGKPAAKATTGRGAAAAGSAKAPAGKTVAAKPLKTLVIKPESKSVPKKSAAAKTTGKAGGQPAGKAPARSAAKPAVKSAAKPVAKSPARSAARPAAKKAPAKKAPANRAPAKATNKPSRKA